MIHIQSKRYQIVLWRDADREGVEPALQIEFDTLAEAKAEFAAQRRSGRYQSGVLIEMSKRAGSWDLLGGFPE